MHLYTNPLSLMTHEVVFPTKDYFLHTQCGVRMNASDPVYSGQTDDVTCSACKYEAARDA